MSDFLTGVRTQTNTTPWTLARGVAKPVPSIHAGHEPATLASVVRAGAAGTVRADTATSLTALGVVAASVACFFLNGALTGWLGHNDFALARAGHALLVFPARGVLPVVSLVGAGAIFVAAIATAGGTRIDRYGAIAFAGGVVLAVLGMLLTILVAVLVVAFYLLIAALILAAIIAFIAALAGS
jgi:hypothetical protein